MNENTNFNYKRASYLALLKRKNLELAKQIEKYVMENIDNIEKLNTQNTDLLLKLNKNISVCAAHSLYRIENEAKNQNKIDYIFSHTCKSKACQLCNAHRQKTLRKKYLRFFKKNKTLVVVSNGKNTKTVTHDTIVRKLKSLENYNIVNEKTYDLMHLGICTKLMSVFLCGSL